jgi:hypothetical protein
VNGRFGALACAVAFALSDFVYRKINQGELLLDLLANSLNVILGLACPILQHCSNLSLSNHTNISLSSAFKKPSFFAIALGKILPGVFIL